MYPANLMTGVILRVGLKIYIDGKFYEKEDAKVSVFDHGFLYGDGVFEGIRAYNGRVFRLVEHVDRLYRSAKTILLDIPMTKEAMVKAVVETLKVNNFRDAYIRLVVSRGAGNLGLDPRSCAKPCVVVICDGLQMYPEDLYNNGLEIMTVSTRRNSPQCLDPNVKSLNYLNNILAKIEVTRAGKGEGLFLNADGYVTEATGDNIFIVKRGKLLTPPPYLGILDGVTRTTILEVAEKAGVPAEEKVFTLYDLYNAEECFMSGTAAEAIPVVAADGRVIGDGRPGEVTKRLIKDFRELVANEGVPIQ